MAAGEAGNCRAGRLSEASVPRGPGHSLDSNAATAEASNGGPHHEADSCGTESPKGMHAAGNLVALAGSGFVHVDADPMGTQSRMASTIVHDLFRMHAARRNMYHRLVFRGIDMTPTTWPRLSAAPVRSCPRRFFYVDKTVFAVHSCFICARCGRAACAPARAPVPTPSLPAGWIHAISHHHKPTPPPPAPIFLPCSPAPQDGGMPPQTLPRPFLTFLLSFSNA